MNNSRLSEHKDVPSSFVLHDLQYLLSQYLHGERFAVQVGLRLLTEPLPPSIDQSQLKRFIEDEKRHVKILEDFILQNFDSILDHHPGCALILANALQSKDPRLAPTLLHGMIEPFGLGSLLGIRRYATDSTLAQLIDDIAADEKNHLDIEP